MANWIGNNQGLWIVNNRNGRLTKVALTGMYTTAKQTYIFIYFPCRSDIDFRRNHDRWIRCKLCGQGLAGVKFAQLFFYRFSRSFSRIARALGQSELFIGTSYDKGLTNLSLDKTGCSSMGPSCEGAEAVELIALRRVV